MLFGVPLGAVLAHLLGLGTPAPAPVRALPFELPALAGHAAGFSGATYVNGRLLVTASVEAAADAVANGAVLGAFVGVVDVAARPLLYCPLPPPVSFVGVVDVAAQTAIFAHLAWPDGRAFLGKVEGLAVRRTLGPNALELLLVTDDDRGGSRALVAQMRLASPSTGR